MKPFRFLSIPTSHYCEKVRWAMDWKGVSYREEMHMPVFHIAAVKRAGGAQTVPVLVTDEGVYKDSTDILHFLDRYSPKPALYPSNPEQRQQVEELEELCDEVLGKNARRLVYSVLLQRKDLFFRMFPEECPRYQVWLLRFAFPLFRVLVRRAYRVNPESLARSRARVEKVFAHIEALLQDGREFLVGDSLTAADISFACMAVPVILPKKYFTKLPQTEEISQPQREFFETLRASPAGLYARKLFREIRPNS